MRNRDLFLTLEDAPGLTLGQRIVRTLQRAIQEGRLPPGAALPGSRVLAEILGANRQTVIPALQELEAQGWLETVPNRGTFVVRELPSGARQAPVLPAAEAAMGFDLPSFLRPVSTTAAGAILLADGAADPRLAPADELAKGYQRALRRHGPKLLRGDDPLGTPLLREAVATWISERHGAAVDPGRILITHGSRGALALLATALFRPGEIAAVENPGNRGAWEILQQGACLDLRPVPVDSEGMDPEALEELLGRERVRLLYLTPRRQFPTAGAMTRERGARILELAARYRLAILEDDYDGEFCFRDPRPEPLLAQDCTGQVIHMGSLSRLLAPGLRLAYLVLPAPLAPFLARARKSREEQGDPAFEWAVADLIRDGELARHLRKARKTYEGRRDLLIALLRERLGEHLVVEPPGGGMGLWIRAAQGVDAEAWVQRARSHGLVLNPPSHFFLGEARQAFRMGFAQADDEELREAVDRLHRALRA